MSLIYPPKEDSYLLQEVLKEEIPKRLNENNNLKILEVGSGSGIQLETVKNLGVPKKNLSGVDINYDAVERGKKLGFNCFFSNLFSEVKETFDVIIFNPPYLPEDKREDGESRLATTGGKKGNELIKEFLIQSKEYLNPRGRIFILISSLTKEINWEGYEKKLIKDKKLFFEKLEVWELSAKVN